MTSIDLEPFCGDVRHNDYLCLRRPIHTGQWTIASNGHIAIRVPRLPSTPETLGVPDKIAAIFDRHSSEDLGELPLFTPPTGTCKCKDCDGIGKEFDESGRFPVSDCTYCDGSGAAPQLNYTSVELDGVILAARYLEKIRGLPFPKFAYGSWPAPYAPGRAQGCVYFSFEGGIGALMPMRYHHHFSFNLTRPGRAA